MLTFLIVFLSVCLSFFNKGLDLVWLYLAKSKAYQTLDPKVMSSRMKRNEIAKGPKQENRKRGKNLDLPSVTLEIKNWISCLIVTLNG